MKKGLIKIVFYLALLIFFIFVLINVFFGQNLPIIMTSIITQQKYQDVVSFLKIIKDSNDFNSQLNYYKEFYPEIEKEVFLDDQRRDQEIQKLENVLKINNKSCDVLVKLAILYFEKKEFSKAKDYYSKAKKVDPTIKINSLEKISSQ